LAARRTTESLVFFALVALAMFALAAPAQAAFPGANGKIAFAHCASGSCDIWTMNADGTNKVDITNTPTASEGSPAWSADGKQIVYVRDRGIWVMNADGTLQSQVVPALTTNGCGFPGDTLDAPAWSPDSSKIVFVRFTCTRDPDDHELPSNDLYTVNPDGTGEALLHSEGTDPRWSPDGTKIGYTFYAFGGGAYDIYWITPDGSTSFHVTETNFEYFGDWSPDGAWMTSPFNEFDATAYKIHPDGTGKTQVQNIRPYRWSPDGTKFLAGGGGTAGADIYTANVDGTGVTYLTNNGNSGSRAENPDWQPIPYTGYPRPRGATPFKTYLVPAFKQCTAPNTSHGAPLFYGSCGPPVQASNFLTIGAPDANGVAANSTGVIFLRVKATSPSDVLISGTITDVRCRPATASAVCNGANNVDGPDYSGELQGNATIRVTDHYNGPGLNEPATVQDIQFPINMTCANTADTTRGGVCTVNTSGPVVCPECGLKEGQRTVVQLAQYQVFDGGSDGQVSTTTDNTLFEVQGIFIP
jgi:Tol biopolymer transport system component